LGIRAERNSYLEKWAKEGSTISILDRLAARRETRANPQY
jgi:hypothetical protein